MLLVVLFLYVLSGQTYLSNDYLMPCLEQLSSKWGLSETGTGILMALGMSIPELTTNILSCYKVQMIGYGFGTIVGSGVFDFTICFGIMAIFSFYYHQKALKMQMKTLMRDIQVYLGTILYLAFVFWDYQISFTEAFVLALFYPSYLLYSILQMQQQDTFDYSLQHQQSHVPTLIAQPEKQQVDDDDLDGEEIGIVQQVKPTESPSVNYALMPFHYIFEWTIPKNKPELAFLIISLYCFLSVNLSMTVVDEFVDQFQVSHAFVGLTIASWGGNIGGMQILYLDILNASIAAKHRKTELATSCIIGSQIMNLQICLGIPWLLTILIHQENIVFYDESIFSSMIGIVIVVCISYCAMMLLELKLTYQLGTILLMIYLCYFLFEFNQQQ